MKPELEERFGIEKIALFGSVARGEEGDRSDVDLYVVFRNRRFRTIAAAWNWLEERLQRPVDLVYEHPNLRPGLKRTIEKGAIYG
ncbi:nucleotidyltransferase family protein [Hydrogenimonas sp.]